MSAEFAKELRHFRKRSELTQEELAEKCSQHGIQLTASLVSHYEKNRRTPSSQQVVWALSRALELSSAESSHFLSTAGYITDQSSLQEEVPQELRKFFSHLFSNEYMSPLRILCNLPSLNALDDTFTNILTGWKIQADARTNLRERRWDEVLENIATAESKIRQTYDQFLAYANDALGQAYYHKGQITRAEQALSNSEIFAERSGDKRAIATSAVHLASLYKNTGRLEKAKAQYDIALMRFQELKDDRQIAWVERRIGTWYLFQGLWSEAEPFLKRSLLTFERIGNGYEAAQTLNGLGWACSLKGDWDAAVAQRRKALALTQETNQKNGWDDKLNLLRCYLFLGDDLRQIGQNEESETFLTQALSLSQEIDEQYERGRILLCLAKLYYQRGGSDREKALRCAEQSRDFHIEKGNTMRLVQSLNHLGRCYEKLAQYEDAKSCFVEALSLCELTIANNLYYRAAALINLSSLCCNSGIDPVAVERRVTEAEEICRTNKFFQHFARLRLIQAEFTLIHAKHPLQQSELAKAASFCAQAYELAYQFNQYVANEVHKRVCEIIRHAAETFGVERRSAFVDKLHKELADYMAHRSSSIANTTTHKRDWLEKQEFIDQMNDLEKWLP